jgi:L,D-transpeptidase ErfK/SrfK
MKPILGRLWTAALLAAVLALTGCALLNSPFGRVPPPAPAPEPVAPPAPPPLPEPVATHRFELSNDTDDLVGVLQQTEVGKDDTLPDIARRFNVGYEEIVRANPGVDPWLPGAGRKVLVPTQFVLPNAPHEGVVINLAAMRIFYYPKRKAGEPQVVFTHPIGVGKVGWSTPEGVTKIVSRETDPTWRPSAAVRKEHAENGDPIPAVVGPGPDNPLGKYKFNLGWPSYLIHGTNKPYGVGLRSSHGCIRLYPEDIERFYNMIPIGTQVRVVNQPFVFGWHDGRLVLQAYTVLEDDPRDWTKARKTLLAKSMSSRLQKLIKESNVTMDWEVVSAVAHKPRGVAVPVAGEVGSVEAVVATATLVQNRIPEGANWDGADDVARDEQSYKQLLSEREPLPQPATAAAAKPRG